jgi:hypothetical protein
VVRPVLETEKSVVVETSLLEDEMAKTSCEGEMLLEDEMKRVRLAKGVEVPIPTLPALSTRKVVPVDEPMAKAGALPFPAVGLMERSAQGVEEPTPRKPLEVMVVVPVAPAAKKLVRSDLVNSLVEVDWVILSVPPPTALKSPVSVVDPVTERAEEVAPVAWR